MSIKPFFIFLTFFIVCSSVYALDYRLISSPPDCVGDITVNLSATMPIDVGEYNFLWCNNTSHVWSCPCDKPVVLSVQTNTVNTYNIQITYITQSTSSGGSGGRSRHNYVLVQHNDSIQVKQNQYIKLPNNYTDNKSQFIQSNLSINATTYLNITKGDDPIVVVEPNAGIVEQEQPQPPAKDGFLKRLWLWIKKILMYDIGGKK